LSGYAVVSSTPSAEGGLLARAVVAIDRVADPLLRATYRGDLAELIAEAPPERRALALLLLLVEVDRSLDGLPALA
jgi:hypothetical protein